MLVTNKCIKCGACINCCPVGAISRDKKTLQAVIDPDICVNCGYCISICPVNAITTQTAKKGNK